MAERSRGRDDAGSAPAVAQLLTRDSILTPDELAAALKCSRRKVDAWDFPYFVAGREVRFIWGQVIDSGGVARTVAPSPGLHLYFFRNPYNGRVKIGVSRNIERRRAELEYACGHHFDTLRVVANHGVLEDAIHKSFASDRLVGEWFAPSSALLEFAASDESCCSLIIRRLMEAL